MSDAAVTVIVSGVAQVAVALVAFLTLWIKIRYGIVKAEEAANKAEVVEGKIDTNTRLTRASADVQTKTAGVVEKIHTATNSDREKMEKRLAALESANAALLVRIDGLHSAALARQQELIVQGRQTPAETQPPSAQQSQDRHRETLVPDPRHPGGPGAPPPPPVPRRET